MVLGSSHVLTGESRPSVPMVLAFARPGEDISVEVLGRITDLGVVFFLAPRKSRISRRHPPSFGG